METFREDFLEWPARFLSFLARSGERLVELPTRFRLYKITSKINKVYSGKKEKKRNEINSLRNSESSERKQFFLSKNVHDLMAN